jgi:hypothetical protein
LTRIGHVLCKSRDKYLNIRRSEANFLKGQKVYQITKVRIIPNKPIMSSSPNERYGIDCTNMVSYASANGIDRGWKLF